MKELEGNLDDQSSVDTDMEEEVTETKTHLSKLKNEVAKLNKKINGIKSKHDQPPN
jgi:uncharacterized coiled-coil protein SlyX